MKKEIDVRGIACPGPVLATKKALDALETGLVQVITDNPVAVANLEKLAKGLGCALVVQTEGDCYRLLISKGESGAEMVLEKNFLQEGIVLFLGNDTIGRGEEALGKLLLKSFLYTLTESAAKPEKILLMNGGVKAALAGAEALEHLQTLEQQGVEILTCGTCLDFYRVKEQLKAGKISNMYDLSEAMLRAKKVLSFT